MEIIITPNNHFDLIKPIGRLDSYTAPEFKETMCQHIKTGCKAFVIDMEALDYISSSGIMVLVHLQKACGELGGGIALLSTPELLLSTIKLCGVEKMFSFFDNFDSAAAFFQG